ncbi:hypothetical protein D3C79_1039790 [compost metagenome]
MIATQSSISNTSSMTKPEASSAALTSSRFAPMMPEVTYNPPGLTIENASSVKDIIISAKMLATTTSAGSFTVSNRFP